jgi:hypothetical protein
VERTILAMCEDLATPVSLGVAIRVRYGCWDDLASMRVDPKHYLKAEAYWADAQCVSFLRKCQDLPTSFDRKAAALKNFWHAERECFRTNQRLLPFLYGKAYAPEEEGIYSFLLRVRKIVEALLGPCPDVMDGRFGPGATFGDRGQLTTVPDKMSSCPTLTTGALPFAAFPWKATAWASACASAGRESELVRGNRFTTVPKDCTKDRGIAVEPSINLFFQLAYGSAMKRRLARAGLDLLMAQDVHRRVACEASIRGHLATIDLSNASDTVCKNLVKFLLPSKWYAALSALRSPFTLVEKRWVMLEKFSSMGNGYTFELETVIFAAISMAAVEASGVHPILGVNVLVFGDDIIVPTESVRCVLSALRWLGFTPNGDKTFSEGPFRESCGGDYFLGTDVRPFFLKEFPREPQQFIALANGIRRLAGEDQQFSPRHHLLRRSWFCVLDALPSHVRRLRGPRALGDIVIHDDAERWQRRWRHGIRYIQCYRPATYKVVDWRHWSPDVVLATALYTAGDATAGMRFAPLGGRKPSDLGVIPRKGVLGYKVGWVPYS